MYKRSKYFLTMTSLALALSMSLSTLASAADTPSLVYDDVNEPALNYEVSYKGTVKQRSKYYDDDRNTIYQSGMTLDTSARDLTYERLHIATDSNGVIPDDQLQYLDTDKVYMDYVHHYSYKKDGVTYSTPMSVFGNDALYGYMSNYYDTFPVQEKNPEEVEEEEGEQLSEEEEAELEEGTEGESDVVSLLENRRSSVSLNIYPDRTTVEDGGSYTSTEAQTVYKIYKSLDNSNMKIAIFKDDIDILPESKLDDPTLSFAQTEHVSKEEVVSADDIGSYITRLGSIVMNEDGTTTYTPAEYWTVQVPINSIDETLTVKDYAKYIHDHYPDMVYGTDYFVYQDPGTYDESYERQVSQYVQDVENSGTIYDAFESYKLKQTNLKEVLSNLSAHDSAAASQLETAPDGTKIELSNPKVPFKDLDAFSQEKLNPYISNLGTFEAVSNAIKESKVVDYLKGKDASDGTVDGTVNVSSAIATWNDKPTAKLSQLVSEINAVSSKVDTLKNKYDAVLSEAQTAADKQNKLVGALEQSGLIEEIDESEYNSADVPGRYLKLTYYNYKDALDALSQEVTDRKAKLDDLSTTLDGLSSYSDSYDTLNELYLSVGEDILEYDDEKHSYNEVSANELVKSVKGLVDDLNEASKLESVEIPEAINWSKYTQQIQSETRYYRVFSNSNPYSILMKYAKSSTVSDGVSEWLSNNFTELLDDTGHFNVDYLAKYILYDSHVLNADEVENWETMYTNITKFSLREFTAPVPQTQVNLYVRSTAAPYIRYVYDGILLKTFNNTSVSWTENGQTMTYYVAPLGSDSTGFVYTALVQSLTMPNEEAEYFGVKFKFNRDTTGINRYYSATLDGVNTENSALVKNITNDDTFTPEVNGFIGVSYYGYFDKFVTQLSALEDINLESFCSYENPVKIGNDIVNAIRYDRNISNTEAVNGQWASQTYRNPELYTTAPHIIWYEIADTGTLNVGFRNYAVVGGTDTLLVKYTDPSRRTSYIGNGDYTRGPDTFVMNFKNANEAFDRSAKWPTPAAFNYDFSLSDYNSVYDDIKSDMTLNQMLAVANRISSYSGYDDDTKIQYVNQMVLYKKHVPEYIDTIKENYEGKNKYKSGASGLTANDYSDMSITDQTIAPYTYEDATQKIVLTKLDRPQTNVHNDLYFMLDTYGTNIEARRYVRLKRDAEVGSSGVKVKDASGNLESSLASIYELYLTERLDDKYTHEYTNNILASTQTSSGLPTSEADSLRTYSLVPGVKYIPSVVIDDVEYDYYELTYSIPTYGTWRTTEYLDEDAQLHLIKDYAHPSEGYTKLNTDGIANTYRVYHKLTTNSNTQFMNLYELGYACLNPMGTDYEPDPSNLLVTINTKDAAKLAENKGADKQCGDWAFIATDPYLWTSYANSNSDQTLAAKSYSTYVNLPGESDDIAAFQAKTLSDFTSQFDAAGYHYEHVITAMQQWEKHPEYVDDSSFFAEYDYKPNMTIAVTTAESLDNDISREDVYVDFNNVGATHNIEARYAQFILQEMAKAYLVSDNPIWNKNPNSTTDEELNEILIDADFHIRNEIHTYMELMSTDEKRALMNLFQLYRHNKSLGRSCIYSDISISYTQGVGPNFEVQDAATTRVLSGSEANEAYSLLVYFAQKYVQDKVTVTKDAGYTDRLANNIVFLSNLYPSISYRICNVTITVKTAVDTSLYKSVEGSSDGQTYTFDDSKLIPDADLDNIAYTPNLIVWYAKQSAMLPSVNVQTPVSSGPIQPLLLEVDDSYSPEVALDYAYIVGVRITSPGTYKIYDADVVGSYRQFTVTSSGMIFNTFYGPFDPSNPEAYLNVGVNGDESPTVRINENTYSTEYCTKETIYDGRKISSDRYIYYMIANVSPAEAEKISAQISLTYDNSTNTTVDMLSYNKGQSNGIYIFYYKVQCPGRYFLMDTSKTITIYGTQPTFTYARYTKAGDNYNLYNVQDMMDTNAYIEKYGRDAWNNLGFGTKEISWYSLNTKSTLFALWDYDPMIKINVSYPGYNGSIYPYKIIVNGETKYGFWLPNPESSTPSTTSSASFDGEYKVDNTQVLITSSLNTELYIGYPLFSDKQLLMREGDDSDISSAPSYSSHIRNMNWYPGIHLFWVDDQNKNYQIKCSEYWRPEKVQVLTDTTFEMDYDDNTMYLHRMLIPYPGTFTVKGKGNEDKWTVIISPPSNFYIGDTVLRQDDDTIVHLAKSYNYRPSKDPANEHIRVLYLASTDYLIPGYYSALLHEHDWNIKATWLNQDIGLYKTGVYRDTIERIDGESDYIEPDTGKVFYAFDERIIKQHDAELERYESKLPSFHPLYAEITLPTADAPYMGGYGLQLLYHNRIDRKVLIRTLFNKTVPDNMSAEDYISSTLTSAQVDELNRVETKLMNYLGYIDVSKGTTVKIDGISYNISDVFSGFVTKTDTDMLVTDSVDGSEYIPNSLYPFEKQANGFYYASNIPAYAQADGKKSLDKIPDRDKYGYDVDPSDSSRLTMPTNPWAGTKLEPRVEDGLNGFYYTNYRIKKNADKLGTGTTKYDDTLDTFLTTDRNGAAQKSNTDILGNRFYNSDTYHILSWWSNPNVSNQLYQSYKSLDDISMKMNSDGTYTLTNPTVGDPRSKDGVASSSTGTHQYGRAIEDSQERKQTFKKYNKRFWSPFDNNSGLTNYDLQGYYTGISQADKFASPYRALPEEKHKIIVHPIYHYVTNRLNKYQHDMVLPADFSGELKLPSYITDIDTAVINTYEDHDAKTYTGGYYTYTLYVAGQTGLILQANHTGDFILTPKKSQHLIVRQTSPWGSYAEYDLNILFTSHIQKDASNAQLDKNYVDLRVNLEDIPNPYHQDKSVSYKLTSKETTMSAGEYMPQVIKDLEADSPIYSQMLAVYMLYQDVSSYRYYDTGHMWMYDWFNRDGYHMNTFAENLTLDQYKTLFKSDNRYDNITTNGVLANEVVEGYRHDHVQSAGYTKLIDGGDLVWVPATYYDTSNADFTNTFLSDGLLDYTQNMIYKTQTNDVQDLYKSVTTAGAVPYTGKSGKILTDMRSNQNMRTFVRFIDAMHNNEYSKYSLNKYDSSKRTLLRDKSYSYLGAYPAFLYDNNKLITPIPDDKQLKDARPWFFAETFGNANKLYQSTDVSALLDLYRNGNRNPTWNDNTYVAWSDNFGLGGGLVGFPNRDWHHYYPDIPSTYEIPAGNITKDYMNMTQILREGNATSSGSISTWFGEALSDLLGRTIFTLPNVNSDNQDSQTSLDMFNYLNIRTALHVRSYQDCVNVLVYDSEAYNIMQSEIKPIIDLDNIQESDIDNDSNFWVKSLIDTFVNR